MTQGRCGSLHLHRKRLALSAPCRFYRRTILSILPILPILPILSKFLHLKRAFAHDLP